MDTAQVLSFAFVAALLVMSPGPNGLLIAKTVPSSGKTAGFFNIAGFVAAFYLHGCLSILGISALLVHSAEAFFIVKIVGAAYLCWIGVRALRDAWRPTRAVPAQAPAAAKSQVNLRTAVLEGFLTNALNPKVSMFYLAAFPQFVSPGQEATAAFSLVFVHALLNAIWFSAMVMLLHSMRRAVARPSLQRWLKGVTGAVFVGFGAKLALLKP